MLRAVPSFVPPAGEAEIHALDAELGLLDAVPTGRIVEICGGASASIGARILVAVQARGEAVAWLAPRSAGLFPPDLAAAGLDLDGLVVVHLPESDSRAGPKAAELLLRTGAIGAVVLDATALDPRARDLPAARTSARTIPVQRALPTAWQGRLLGILREHDARLVILSGHAEEHESMGPLVSVRLSLARRRVEGDDGVERFEIRTRVTKDKSGVLAGRVPALELRRAPIGSAPLLASPSASRLVASPSASLLVSTSASLFSAKG